MKKFFSLIFILLLGMSLSFSQTPKTKVSVIYSFGGTDIVNSNDIIGGPSYSGRGYYGVGAIVSLALNHNLDIQTGVSYVGNRFKMTPAPTGNYIEPSMKNVNVFSIPLTAKYHFFQFLYVSGGPLFSINSGDRDLNGIGLSGMFGMEYEFKNGLSISFGPTLRYYGMLPWKNYRLINSGVNFGIGYRL